MADLLSRKESQNLDYMGLPFNTIELFMSFFLHLGQVKKV